MVIGVESLSHDELVIVAAIRQSFIHLHICEWPVTEWIVEVIGAIL